MVLENLKHDRGASADGQVSGGVYPLGLLDSSL